MLILDEVSLFMKNRTEDQRVEDEKTLVVLSNRLAKTHCLPVWTICSAQQALESKMGVKNIIANDRLKNVSLLQDESELLRHRAVTGPHRHEARDHRRLLRGLPQGLHLARCHRQRRLPAASSRSIHRAIDVLRAVSYNLTTLRSSVHFMHQTLKTQRKAKSNELITLWQMFDDVVSYEEDPSGTTAGIAAIQHEVQRRVAKPTRRPAGPSGRRPRGGSRSMPPAVRRSSRRCSSTTSPRCSRTASRSKRS